ncbi:MAG TPA: mannose-1-phosphate guanylyltransferase [Luteolibacter sp.]|nr:mannose-1-phosphate guanylyltransferase [Luteolibacter sp.]
MAATQDHYALILAGGSGSRFWPLSRNERPKQLLDLFGTGTLLEAAVARLEGLVPLENILVLTNAAQLEAVRRTIPRVPTANIFAEPARRDTGPAVALGIGLVAARNPQATMMVLPSDQLIRDLDGFQSVMHDALAAAKHSNGLVTIGIQPTWPCPSYGYIERGEVADIPGAPLSHRPHEVKRFREKPSTEAAAGFLAQGGFSWNAGMFVWSLPTVIGQLEAHAPELAAFVHELRTTSDPQHTIATKFPSLPAKSIDYALMEHAQRVLNIEATFDWDDVGSWISVAKYLEAVGDGNRSNSEISEVDARNNIIFNARAGSRIALLGVEDLIVVQTEDALLVCRRDQADAIRHLCGKLPEALL